ncbi:hypothetical protein ACKWTF_013029 [Chironomus riparius]
MISNYTALISRNLILWLVCEINMLIILDRSHLTSIKNDVFRSHSPKCTICNLISNIKMNSPKAALNLLQKLHLLHNKADIFRQKSNYQIFDVVNQKSLHPHNLKPARYPQTTMLIKIK